MAQHLQWAALMIHKHWSRAFAVALCSLLFGARAAQAADVAFFPVETANLAPSDTVAVGELLASAYAAASGLSVLAPARSAETLAQSTSYEDAARALGVGEFVRTSALGVGRQIVVTATRQRADGTVMYRSKLTASSLEDLVPVCDRIAKALYHQHDDELERTYRNVTLTEARPQNRIWRELLFGVKTGLHLPFARDARLSPAVAAEFDMRLEHAKFFVEFGAGLLLPTRMEDLDGEYDLQGEPVESNRGTTGGLFAEIGASRFLTDGDVALYAGAGLIPKVLFRNDTAGMALYGQLGLTLPRASSTRFSTDLRFAQSVLAQHLENGNAVFPSEVSLHAGVGW
jgi:hypothetical protein